MSTMMKNWDPEAVEKFIKPESQQKSPTVFRETHVPIDKIKADILRPYDGQSAFVSEEEFRNAVLDSEIDDDNRIFIIKGEVGSGKSHLCQWLEYEINGYGDDGGYDDTHVAIHISRSNTKLSDILKILHDPINKEYDEVGDIGELDPEEVADFIIQGLKTFHKNRGKFKEFDLDKFLKEHGSKKSFRDVLVENLTDYQEAVEQENKEQQIDLITRKDYGRVCLNSFGTAKYKEGVYPTVRRAVHDLLTRNLGIEDFKRQLVELSTAYKEAGKRPVLICEDLTTFNVLKDDLLDHIFELSSSHYDIVLGWTSGWERENIDDALSTSEDSLSYMQQRCQGYLSMTDDQGRAYFLEDTSASILLVKEYLNAIKRHSENTANVPDEAFDKMYPFSEAFVYHVYQNLVQDGNRQQTPRVLLVHVISDCLLSTVPPFKKIETNAFVEKRPSLVSLEESDECQQLTKWYGCKNDGGDSLWVPKAIFEAFNVEYINGVDEDGKVIFPPEYATKSEDIYVPNSTSTDSRGSREPRKVTSTDASIDEPSTEGDTTEQETSEPSRQTSASGGAIPGDKQAQFQDWIQNGSEYPSSNSLKKGVQMTLERWYEPTRLANENATTRSAIGIYCARGSDIPVEIKGPDSPSSLSYTIDHGVQNYKLYIGMLYAGVNDGFDPDTNFDRLRGWADNQVVKYRHHMRDTIEDALPKSMGIEEFIVFSKFIMMNTGTGTNTITPETIFSEYEMETSSPLHQKSDLDLELPLGARDAFNDITRKSNAYSGLAEGFFLLKSSVVDYQRLNSAISTVEDNLEQFITELSSTDVDNIPKAYKVGTTRNNAKTTVRGLVESVSDYCNELLKMEQSISFDVIESEIEEYRSLHSSTHTQDQLSNIYEQLENSIAPLHVTKESEWATVGDDLHNSDLNLKLGEFGETLDKFENIDVQNSIEIIAILHDYQSAKQDQRAWKIYSILSDIIQSLDAAKGAGETDFKNQVRDSSEFTSFTKKRDQLLKTLEGN